MKDFFISYNRADKAWAEWIAWQLEEAGYTTVLQAWDFTPGTNFALKMHEAASEAERTIAVLSPDYLTSIFTGPEWAAAFAQDPTGEKGLLVPIRVRQCDPAGLLGPIVHHDLLGLDEASAKVALLAAIKRGRAKPDAKPAFPPTAGRSVTSRPRFPGALPPIWNVPHRRNPNFTGREELLASLHASLTSGDYAALTQAMHGLGGVGKTQVVIEYAYRYASEYDAVLWVSADDPVALGGQFASLAGVIELEVDPADQPAAVAGVQRWLRENSHWLLIFDNAEAAADIQSYLPHTGAGHVIITSRNPEWRKVAKTLAVQRLVTKEAIAFLLTRCGRDDPDEDERTAAATLAEELGGLALALEQAAAYVETHGLSLSEYLRLFQKHREEVLAGDPPPGYPHTIDTVWEISMDTVRRVSPASAELLRMLPFFASDNIPLSLIQSGARVVSGALADAGHDELKLREAVRVLRRHSLIEVGDTSVSLHREVQAVTLRSLTPTERHAWAQVAIVAVRAELPTDTMEPDAWGSTLELLPHAITSAEHCAREHIALEDAAASLNATGIYLFSRGDYSSAQSLLQRAVELYEIALGAEDVRVAASLSNLGTVLEALGDSRRAKAQFEKALRLFEAGYGVDHDQVAICLNNLGNALESLGDLPGARDHYERALRLGEATYGKDHAAVAVRLNNLGSVLKAQRDFVGARANYERALQIFETVLGRDHFNAGLCENNLGSLFEETGDLERSREYYERALTIVRKNLGEDHPSTRMVQANLDALAQRIGHE